MVTSDKLSMQTCSPIHDWFPTIIFQGYLILTVGLITTPFPTLAPNILRILTFIPENGNIAERKKEWEKAKLAKKDMEEVKKVAIGKSDHMSELTVWLNENVDLAEEENEEDIEEEAFDPILFESCNILVDVINMGTLLPESKI